MSKERTIKDVRFRMEELVRRVFANPSPLAVEFQISEALEEIDRMYSTYYEKAHSKVTQVNEHIPSDILDPEVSSPKPIKKK